MKSLFKAGRLLIFFVHQGRRFFQFEILVKYIRCIILSSMITKKVDILFIKHDISTQTNFLSRVIFYHE